MFETVAPPLAGRPSRSALYEALTFSLSVHAAAGLIALAMNLWQVTFPVTSPAAMVSFVLTAPAPPPPPPPPPKPRQVAADKVTTKVKIPDNAFVAPTVIPDTIPLVKPQAFTPVAIAIPNGVIGGVDDGQPDGVLGGVKGGISGGVVAGKPGSIAIADDGRVHISRDKKLPLMPVSQTYPGYPEDARMRGWEDELVVRYVIGKDGRVKEVTVLQKPDKALFIDNTLKAIRTWRFKPFMQDGQPQEVVHELTIFYRLNSTS